jgi:hypothetical protein
MDTLKELWRNPHLDMYNKYFLFRAILMNLLLWGQQELKQKIYHQK